MSSIPPVVGFHPTDEELLTHYLKRKNLGQPDDMIPEIDVLDCEPTELHSTFGNKEFLFFCRLKPKYSKGDRSDRTTKNGYWKPKGGGCTIKNGKDGEPIGEKRTLVFHEGRRPNDKRTSWLMYEYRLKPEHLADGHDKNKKLPYVVCRIKNTKGKKPMMGQEGDDLRFCDNQHDEVVAAPRETSVEEAMDSLPSLQPLDGTLSNHTTNPAYRPREGADQGLSSFRDFSDHADGSGQNLEAGRSTLDDFGFCWACFEDLSTTSCIHGGS